MFEPTKVSSVHIEIRRSISMTSVYVDALKVCQLNIPANEEKAKAIEDLVINGLKHELISLGHAPKNIRVTERTKDYSYGYR